MANSTMIQQQRLVIQTVQINKISVSTFNTVLCNVIFNSNSRSNAVKLQSRCGHARCYNCCFIGYSRLSLNSRRYLFPQITQECLPRVCFRSRYSQCSSTSVWSVGFFGMRRLSHRLKRVTLLPVRARLTILRTLVEEQPSVPSLQVVVLLSLDNLPR